MSKTVSARISDKQYEIINNICGKTGCTLNDFLKTALIQRIEDDDDFDEEDDEPSDIEPEPLTRKRPELDEDKFKPHHDIYGNYWTYDENTEKWTCHLNPKNLKISK